MDGFTFYYGTNNRDPAGEEISVYFFDGTTGNGGKGVAEAGFVAQVVEERLADSIDRIDDDERGAARPRALCRNAAIHRLDLDHEISGKVRQVLKFP